MPKLPKLPKLFQYFSRTGKTNNRGHQTIVNWVLSKYYKLTLELRLPDEYHELNSEIEVNNKAKINFVVNRNISNVSSFIFFIGCQTNTTNWTLKLGLPDEYYELDSGIRVNGEEEVNFIVNRNVSNISSFIFYKLPDKYHKSDSGIEVARLLVTGRICTYVTK
ncbi:hypothetical protein RclHR1_11250005 [Rhizophagus clarus]|uniref:Uncharacterized protein n=1 Tax=Rhizophagus clarus TaxID=94130 RepID=A0A2Z6QVI9_9GLOM|nr:hypothetical protein RclHR1_11250005 [Rhizophagus clarus]